MRTLLTALALVGLGANSCWAHFIWIAVVSDGGQPVARVYFEEQPTAGAAHLIDKIGHSQLVQVDADGERTPLKTTRQEQDDVAWLETALPGQPAVVELTCDYGLYHKTRLFYYAKSVAASSAEALSATQPSKKLRLDIVPQIAAGALQFQVLWQGKPLADAEVTLHGPDEQERPLQTDTQGRVRLDAPQPGRYALLVSHTKADQAGTHHGKQYDEVGHYATLTLDLPQANTAAEAQPSASELLAQARAARAVWNDFPGFAADLVVTLDGKQFLGKVEIDARGRFELQLEGEGSDEARRWASRHLRSLVMHRMPDGSLSDEAEYVDDDRQHPLGRKIRLKGDGMGSVYRIRDNVVRQVNRAAGPTRFTVTVLDVTWNDEQKYLPSAFGVTVWEADKGTLQSSQQCLHQYARHGAYDLPTRIVEVEVGSNHGYAAREILLTGHRLGEQ